MIGYRHNFLAQDQSHGRHLGIQSQFSKLRERIQKSERETMVSMNEQMPEFSSLKPIENITYWAKKRTERSKCSTFFLSALETSSCHIYSSKYTCVQANTKNVTTYIVIVCLEAHTFAHCCRKLACRPHMAGKESCLRSQSNWDWYVRGPYNGTMLDKCIVCIVFHPAHCSQKQSSIKCTKLQNAAVWMECMAAPWL